MSLLKHTHTYFRQRSGQVLRQRSGQVLRQRSGQVLRQRSGQAMLIAVVIMGSILLSITTIAGYLSTQRLKTSSDVAASTRAIYAADAGIEWNLYKNLISPQVASAPSFSNGASMSCSQVGNVITCTGTSAPSTRSLYLTITTQ